VRHFTRDNEATFVHNDHSNDSGERDGLHTGSRHHRLTTSDNQVAQMKHRDNRGGFTGSKKYWTGTRTESYKKNHEKTTIA
jgi:hypothetical protein